MRRMESEEDIMRRVEVRSEFAEDPSKFGWFHGFFGASSAIPPHHFTAGIELDTGEVITVPAYLVRFLDRGPQKVAP